MVEFEQKKLVDITVIIPCFNCDQTITETLKSVFNQSVTPKEIILVNDGSNTATTKLLKELSLKYENCGLVLYEFKLNKGVGAARRFALGKARHEYIAFLDSDDIWVSEKLKLQLDWMMLNPNSMLTGHGTEIRKRGFIPPSQLDCIFQAHKISFKKMLFKNYIATRTAMIRNPRGRVNFSNLRCGDDYLFWLDMTYLYNQTFVLDIVLSHSFKADYADDGLSSNLLRTEIGELNTYKYLFFSNKIKFYLFLIICIFSIMKYIKRLFFKAYLKLLK
jgi:glycosyltransferase involved in cell wall biosynthesis